MGPLKKLYKNALIFIFFVGCSSGSGLTFSTAVVTLSTTGGSWLVTAEIADTATKRSQGLMNRTSLDAGAGMLFVFDEAGRHSFWMKDTPLSLDILFISAEKIIVTVEENTTPLSTDSILPTEDALYVLEVNAGTVAEHGVAVGDAVAFSL